MTAWPLIGAILNSRNSFAAPMWTPILNNVVVIAVGVLFVATAGLHRTPATVPGSGVMLLGVGTTLGIVIQTLALIPALRQVRFGGGRGSISAAPNWPRSAGWPATC